MAWLARLQYGAQSPPVAGRFSGGARRSTEMFQRLAADIMAPSFCLEYLRTVPLDKSLLALCKNDA